MREIVDKIIFVIKSSAFHSTLKYELPDLRSRTFLSYASRRIERSQPSHKATAGRRDDCVRRSLPSLKARINVGGTEEERYRSGRRARMPNKMVYSRCDNIAILSGNFIMSSIYFSEIVLATNALQSAKSRSIFSGMASRFANLISCAPSKMCGKS